MKKFMQSVAANSFALMVGANLFAPSLIGLALALGFMLSLPGPAAAAAKIYQQAPFASTPNPVGSGGRAVAWGGAFIAIADDATAASWNPGGLAQLVKPETSVALSYHTRQEDLSFSGYSSDSQSAMSNTGNLNYASVVYPFHAGEMNMVVSLNYQRLYEFDRDLKYNASGSGVSSGGNPFIYTQYSRLQQTGALTTVTPAFCVQITPAWAVGLAVNFWGLDGDGDGWEQQWQVNNVSRDPTLPGSTVEAWSEGRETYKMKGTNFVIGAQYKIQNWTFAGVYKSGFDADVKFTGRGQQANYFPLAPKSSYHYPLVLKETETLTWPQSYGVGAAYRYSDRLSFAVDAYTTRWSEYKLKTDEGELNLITGGAQENAHIQDTWQVRMGGEYLWITPKYVFALRAGAFFDPEPLDKEINDFYGLTAGVGFVYQRFAIDGALQYRWANNIKMENLKVEGVEASADVQDWFAIVSVIYYLGK